MSLSLAKLTEYTAASVDHVELCSLVLFTDGEAFSTSRPPCVHLNWTWYSTVS